MRSVNFYRTESGSSPIEDFLDALSSKQAQKVIWVLKVIEELEVVPKQYLKKIVNSEEIWEIRVKISSRNIRLLGFFHRSDLIILTNGFVKKTRKIPKNEIKLAEKRKKEYLKRSKSNE